MAAMEARARPAEALAGGLAATQAEVLVAMAADQ